LEKPCVEVKQKPKSWQPSGFSYINYNPTTERLFSYSDQTFSILILEEMAEKITDLKNKCVCSDYCDDKQDAGDDCSLSIEKLNLLPRKKLLVLDVGGLLCQRVHLRDKSRIQPFRNPDASHGSILGRNSCLYLKV
jgi:hypothetical protein